MHRIVYDHQTFSLQSVGGISRYFCELASRVHAADGFNASILAPVHLNEYLQACSVPTLGVHAPTSLRRASRIYRMLNDALTPGLLRVAKPSLVHRTYYYTAPPRRARVPFVVTVFDMIHELFKDQFPAADPTSARKRLSVDRADHVICISQNTADDLVRLFGIPRERISVTHLGFSAAFGEPVARAQTGARPYLLYVGHRGGYKNFKRILEAYAASRRLRQELDLVVFGGFEFDAQECALIASVGLRDDAVRRMTGDDRQLASAYASAHAFVYPSEYEGFGIPPLEAMASDCPVACSDTSSLPEVVGKAAVLFDPRDVGSIREALESVCFDANLRGDLIAEGRRRVRLFSWDRCADETIAIYRRLLR